jgi:hypothetical protein
MLYGIQFGFGLMCGIAVFVLIGWLVLRWIGKRKQRTEGFRYNYRLSKRDLVWLGLVLLGLLYPLWETIGKR